MSNEVRIHTGVDGKAGQDLKSLRGQFDDMSKSGVKGLLGVGVAAGAAAGGIGLAASAADAAASAVIDFAAGSIAKASDLRESMSLTQQVFETNTDAVEKWAQAKDDAFSQTEALNFASQFGNAFKNVGESLDEATTHAEAFTKLSGDLGSAFNKSSEEAANALRSGLLGESEPLRAFGVFLDEAKVKAKALSMGMKPLNGAFTDGQKVAARYALIMEQTADSQGMFGRDTSSLADAQKRLSSNIDDLQAKLGTDLIPFMVTATNEAGKMVDGFDELTDVIRENQAVISPLVDTLQLLTGTYAHLHQDTSKQADAEAEATKMAQGLKDVIEERAAANKTYIDSLRRVDGATGSVAGASAAAARRIQAVGKAAGVTGAKFDDMRSAIREAAGILNEQKRGHQETTLKIEGTELALRKNRAELKKLEEIKHPTLDQQIDINNLKLAIDEGKDSRVELRAELAAAGKVNMSTTKSWIDKLVDSETEAGTRAHEWYDWLSRVQGIGGGGGGGKKGGNGHSTFDKKPTADGGFRPAGSLILAGERGPEIGIVGQDTTFLDANKTAALMGGGGLTINISGVSVLTPGSAEALARQIGPHVTRWQQQRGL